MTTVPISAIHLVITDSGRATVAVEIDGEWHPVITDTPIASHIVEARAIAEIAGADTDGEGKS